MPKPPKPSADLVSTLVEILGLALIAAAAFLVALPLGLLVLGVALLAIGALVL